MISSLWLRDFKRLHFNEKEPGSSDIVSLHKLMTAFYAWQHFLDKLYRDIPRLLF